MKIRLDFISNSSTTSFTLVGCLVSKYDFAWMLYCKLEYKYSLEELQDKSLKELCEIAYKTKLFSPTYTAKVDSESNLRCHYMFDEYATDIAVGLSFEYDMQDNQTKKAFCKKVKDYVLELFPNIKEDMTIVSDCGLV